MVRGHSGMYKGFYLRSSLEFCFAYYLDHKGIRWDFEKETFFFDGLSYKPDFYIIDENDNTKMIVEIKGEENKEEGIKKIDAFKNKYPDVPIQLVCYKDLLKLYAEEMPLRLNTIRRKWTTEFGAKQEQHVSGELNPMYGKKQSDKTKQLISEKAIERLRDDEYRKAHSERLKKFFSIEANKAYLRKPKVPHEDRMCANPNCGEVFDALVNKETKFCSFECSKPFSGTDEGRRKGCMSTMGRAEEIRSNIKKFMIEWSTDNFQRRQLILLAKFNEVTTLREMFDEINDRFGIKDMRIISKAMFGEDRGRKALLTELKRIAQNI